MLRFSSSRLLKTSSRSNSLPSHQFSLSAGCVILTHFRNYCLFKSSGCKPWVSPGTFCKYRNQIYDRKPLSLSIPDFSLMRSDETNSGILQPVLDMKHVIENRLDLQRSIDVRGMDQNILELELLFKRAKELKDKLENLECQKIEISKMYATVGKITSPEERELKPDNKILQTKGRHIRDEIKKNTSEYNNCYDRLVDKMLQVPNLLDHETPIENRTLVKQICAPNDAPSWTFREHHEEQKFSSAQGYEFPVYLSAEEEIELSHLAQKDLLKLGYNEIGSAESLRKTILYSMGEESDKILRLREDSAKFGDSHIAHVTGVSSLPAMLLHFSQSLLENNLEDPLRLFVIGRSYSNTEKIANNNSLVQCLIAAKNEEVMDIEFANLLHQMEIFYSHRVGIPKFHVQLIPAPHLAPYQRKKCSIVMNATKEFPSRYVGEISTIGDHLSRRLLCCYKDRNGDTQFMHFVHAVFFDINHFLRTSQYVKRRPSIEKSRQETSV